MWSSDIEQLLEKIRINSVILSKQHKKKFFYFNQIIPILQPIVIDNFSTHLYKMNIA